MNILVTGGSGFIGSNLIKYLNELGHAVWFTGNPNENKAVGTYLGYSFADTELPRPLDALVHLAAITDTTIYDAAKMFDVNHDQAMTLFYRTIESGCHNIVYASSCAVYGDNSSILEESMTPAPINPYAESKLILEQSAEKLKDDAKFIGLRFSNVYGHNERHKNKAASMVSRICWQIREGNNPKLFKYGEQVRDWVYYKDVIKGIELAINSKASGVFNIGYGDSASFNKIVYLWNKVLNTDCVPHYIDNPFEGNYQNTTLVNIDKAKKLLGYSPTYNIELGIEDYFNTGLD